MDKQDFENLLKQYPDRKFCLHNGFAGFSYGSPSNPKWITNEKAFEILTKYERLTGTDPIKDFDGLWHVWTLPFEKRAWFLRLRTMYRMIGFNQEHDALYGNDGLG
jgi:hypothetical protein